MLSFTLKKTTQDNDTKTDKALNSKKQTNQAYLSQRYKIKKDIKKRKRLLILTKKAYNIFNLLATYSGAILLFLYKKYKGKFCGYNLKKKFEQ
jgi:hypothetical protein